MPSESITADCCIAGGGPAGIMLGLLLARVGVKVTVLEKHADFLRDFRGDTLHPSTLELMHELGLLEEFLKRPHQQLSQIAAQIGDQLVTVADFSHLPVRCKFVGLMPQWDFLNFLVEHAKGYPTFDLRMQAEVDELVEENGRIIGVHAKTPRGDLRIIAPLTVGADGRGSVVRARARLEVIDIGAPMDVLWMRISKKSDDPPQTLGRVVANKILIMLDRGDYWQCAYLIPKGGLDDLKQRGLAAFQNDLAAIAPFIRDRVSELNDWNDIKLLTVRVDHLREWCRPGLLCIGDAAHAMSPIGGIGINLAIQDAVAAANMLGRPLLGRQLTTADLRAVQLRREVPTRLTQKLQVFLQDRVILRVLANKPQTRFSKLPLPLRLLRGFPFLRRIPARIIGLGFRPEHIARWIRNKNQ